MLSGKRHRVNRVCALPRVRKGRRSKICIVLLGIYYCMCTKRHRKLYKKLIKVPKE